MAKSRINFGLNALKIQTISIPPRMIAKTKIHLKRDGIETAVIPMLIPIVEKAKIESQQAKKLKTLVKTVVSFLDS